MLRFSKRHTQFDEALAKLLTEKPDLAGANFQALRAQLATAERTRKQKDLSRAELLTLWEAQLGDAERASLRQLSKLPGNDLNEKTSVTVSEAVQWAEENLFGRNLVVRECQVWQEALGCGAVAVFPVVMRFSVVSMFCVSFRRSACAARTGS